MDHLEAPARHLLALKKGATCCPWLRQLVLGAVVSVAPGACDQPSFIDYWVDNRSSNELRVTVTYADSVVGYTFVVPPEAHGILVQWEGAAPDGVLIHSQTCVLLDELWGLGTVAGLVIDRNGDVTVREGLGVPFQDAEQMMSAAPCES